MASVPHFVLYEHAVGYSLLKVKEFEDSGLIIPEVESALGDAQKFCSLVQLTAFDPFKNTEAALENCNSISEGLAHPDLVNFLERALPKKKKGVLLGINDSKLAGSLTEAFPGINLQFGGVVTEILRGIRVHFEKLAKSLPHHSLSKAQLSLGHSYSRSKVKFDVHRVDNMVIQSIALLDQLDKDINLFGMRIREWYSYHFPELVKLVPDQYKYSRMAVTILDRNKMGENDNITAEISEILDEDEEKTAQVLEAARTSMGMDISELDLMNIKRFAGRVAALMEYRQQLHEYIKDRMDHCAPSLSALIGEQVGARLISHAGSLTNLAKYPASTVQILGAEKALFRALKTRSNTPKYGLLFHSSFIGRAGPKNKGRISRFLANKCSIAARVDCFSDVPVGTHGEYMKSQVEERLAYFASGTIPKKNIEVMKEAEEAAVSVREKVLKKRKKAAKKAKRILEAESEEKNDDEPEMKKQKMEEEEDDEAETPKPKKKKKKNRSWVKSRAVREYGRFVGWSQRTTQLYPLAKTTTHIARSRLAWDSERPPAVNGLYGHASAGFCWPTHTSGKGLIAMSKIATVAFLLSFSYAIISSQAQEVDEIYPLASPKAFQSLYDAFPTSVKRTINQKIRNLKGRLNGNSQQFKEILFG
ncbi:unnamed protein product [Caenorhabditis auriculariae]|uniref:Nucleolar protein 56 n=1 Tax=Caenorhabditis auriculariae TaxID=2777116 RepID=A0A8S1GT57_9PELO|nr:unnamed protein product [Caenorhabditis auriculariae]